MDSGGMGHFHLVQSIQTCFSESPILCTPRVLLPGKKGDFVPLPQASEHLSGGWSHGQGRGERASLAQGLCLWSGPKHPAARDQSPVYGTTETGSRAQIKGHLCSSWQSVRSPAPRMATT